MASKLPKGMVRAILKHERCERRSKQGFGLLKAHILYDKGEGVM